MGDDGVRSLGQRREGREESEGKGKEDKGRQTEETLNL